MPPDSKIDLSAPDAVEQLDRRYREVIDQAIRDREDRDITNADPHHAAYIITKILEHAVTDVRIYTTKLAQSVKSIEVYASDILIDAAQSFLHKPKSRLSILSRRPIEDAEHHPLIAALRGDEDRHGILTLAALKGKPDSEIPDFAVLDESGYRVEVDNRSASAVVNFGNETLATTLAGYFDAMISAEECQTLLVD